MSNPTIKHTFTSRFEGIERPKLRMEHTPGWCWEDCGDYDGSSRMLFHTTNEEFGMEFTVIENRGSDVSIGLLPTDWDWGIDTAEELLKLGDHVNDLQQWLDDCAAVTAWAREHEGEADHRDR